MSGQLFMFTTDQSRQFFQALRAASIEICKAFGLPTSIGGKKYSDWGAGRPLGVTEHFTAGVTWKGSVRWLGDGSHKNTVSCQMVILDRMLPEAFAIYSKYPELQDLKVVVILLSEGIIPAWHAGWVNKKTFGIENRNAGPVRGQRNKWRWWASGWKAKFPHERLGKYPEFIDGKWWEPFTHGQIHANIVVCQHLHALYQDEGGLDRRWFLPHSATTYTKWDTGRLFPLKDVRDAVFAQMPVDGIPWLKTFQADPTSFAQDIEEDDDALFLAELEERQFDRNHSEYDEGEDERMVVGIDEMPTPDLQALVQAGNWKEELNSVRRALERLQYVTGGYGAKLDEDTALAVYQFQRSHKKLKADKIPGDATQRAMFKRLEDFGLAA